MVDAEQNGNTCPRCGARAVVSYELPNLERKHCIRCGWVEADTGKGVVVTEDFLNLIPKDARENILQSASLSEFHINPTAQNEIERWLRKIENRLKIVLGERVVGGTEPFRLVAGSAKLNGRRTILATDCKLVYSQLISVHKECGSGMHFLYELYYYTDGRTDHELTQKLLKERLRNHPKYCQFLDVGTLQRVKRDVETAWFRESRKM